MVDVIVTTAGGVEEDLIKCMGHTYVGDFQFNGEREREPCLDAATTRLIFMCCVHSA